MDKQRKQILMEQMIEKYGPRKRVKLFSSPLALVFISALIAALIYFWKKS